MLIRLGLNYAVHLAGGLAVGALAVMAVHYARKAQASHREPAHADSAAPPAVAEG